MSAGLMVARDVSPVAVFDESQVCVWEVDGVACGAQVAWRLVTHCCGAGVFPLCDSHAGEQEKRLRSREMVHFECDQDISSWTWFPVVMG